MQEILKNLGFELFGACEFESFKDCLLDCRAKETLPPNLKTVIMVALPYNVKKEKPKNISRYSAVLDYHLVLGEKLKTACRKLKEKYKQNNFLSFVDSSPIPEVTAARKAGLGVLGKNGLLITKKYGSFVFLGEILTDKVFPYKNENGECINCGECEKNCPNHLKGRNNCLSSITQKKGELETQEKELLLKHNTAWGCDICQEVCPLNKDKSLSTEPQFLESYRDEYIMGEDISFRAFNWRGRKVIERNLKILGDKNECEK